MEPNYKWTAKHAEVFSTFVNNLKSENICYFILRNYEGLPSQNVSKDIDIIIEPGQYLVACEVLKETLRLYNIPNFYVCKFERAHCCIGIDLLNEFYIHIDLIEGYLNKGFEIFSFEELYKNTIEYNGFLVLSKPYDAVMLLLYKVIGCGELKDRYKDKISSIYDSYSEKIKDILYGIFTPQYALLIIEALENGDYQKVIYNYKKISVNSKIRVFKAKPLYTLINTSCFLFEKFVRIIICPRKMRRVIAVEAPDGTGKTTFIDLLRVKLAECFVTDITKMHVYHFRPTLFPNLGELGEKVGVMKQDKDFENPHRGKKTNVISSFMRIFYYWLDYFIGGAIAIRRDVQFDKYTIFDRYAYDFIVDPQRSKINLPKKVRVIMAKSVQKPAITFVLLANKETIFARKQELSIDEIDRQLAEFKKLSKIVSGFSELDAEQKPCDIVKDAMAIIVDTFTIKL